MSPAPPRTSRGWNPPPRTLVVVCLVVLGVTAVLAVVGAIQTAATTDEPIHVMRLRNYLDTGWYALDWDYPPNGPGPGAEGSNTFVYAPVSMLLLHAWSVVWGVEGWGQVATSPHAYDVRHLGVVLIGMVGLVAVAAIGRALLGRWRWGLVAAAVLAAIPLWTGYQMYNVKDVPVATGFTLVTLGLVLLVRHDQPTWQLRLVRAATLVAGLVLAIGTRPGIWPGLVASAVAASVGVLMVQRGRTLLTTTADGTLAALAAAGALVVTYPHLFAHPLTALPRTSESSSSFLDGFSSDRTYVPRHLLTDLPTLLLVFVVAGCIAGLGLLWRERRSLSVPAARVGLVGVQALTLPVLAVVMGSDLYHGLRQLLFAVPALAVLAAYGMAWALDRAPRSRLFRPRLVLAGAAVALVLPVVDQVTLQPYQTTYVNLAADLVTTPFLGGGDTSGGDFWRVSIPELVEGQDLQRQVLCKAMSEPGTDISYRFTVGGLYSTTRSLDCREEANGPLVADELPVVTTGDPREFDAVFLKALPTNCDEIKEVDRVRHFFRVRMSSLGRCSVDPPFLDARGVRADDPALGTWQPGDLWLYLADGWEQMPQQPLVSSPVPTARIAFTVSGGGNRTLVIHGSAPADLQVQVNGAPARITRAAGALEIPVTAEQAASPEGVWVTLTRRSHQPVDARVTGLSLSMPSTDG